MPFQGRQPKRFARSTRQCLEFRQPTWPCSRRQSSRRLRVVRVQPARWPCKQAQAGKGRDLTDHPLSARRQSTVLVDRSTDLGLPGEFTRHDSGEVSVRFTVSRRSENRLGAGVPPRPQSTPTRGDLSGLVGLIAHDGWVRRRSGWTLDAVDPFRVPLPGSAVLGVIVGWALERRHHLDGLAAATGVFERSVGPLVRLVLGDGLAANGSRRPPHIVGADARIAEHWWADEPPTADTPASPPASSARATLRGGRARKRKPGRNGKRLLGEMGPPVPPIRERRTKLARAGTAGRGEWTSASAAAA